MSTIKPVVFLGPSLPLERAKSILDADYRMPAKKGDLLQLILRDTKIVGLIDGFFLQDYPPTPIEVYNLVRKPGTVLYGSSSLGALRAVELSKYGMIGIGKIFNLFRREVLDSDDEVAVSFTDYSNYKSEALVDIRYNLFLGEKKSVIDKETKKCILKVAKSIYFPYRTYEDILDRSKQKYPSNAYYIEQFREYLKTNKKSLKELDAILLLNTIKNKMKIL